LTPISWPGSPDQGTLDAFHAVAVHGYPFDWNLWPINEWPDRIAEIEAASGGLPVWVTEAGASSFGADEVQAFAVARTRDLLAGRAPRVFWHSLLDQPPAWGAATDRRESEGSSYYRHFYLGLIQDDNTPKPALDRFDAETLGVSQWFARDDPRLDAAVEWLQRWARGASARACAGPTTNNPTRGTGLIVCSPPCGHSR
jgi:beta-xylosidase